MLILRSYQESAIEKLRDGLRFGKIRQVLMLPTGSGKTAIAASMTKSAHDKGKRVWFIADNIELIEQTVETFEKFGLDVGVIQGQHEKTAYSKAVQVITAQTLTRRWKHFDMNPHWLPDLVFIDECHAQYKAHYELMNMLPKVPVVGLSATPFAKEMGKRYQQLINVISVKELINQGHLNDFEAYGFDTPDMKGVKTSQGDWAADSAAERVTPIIGNIIKTWLKVASDRKTIVFACNIAHSKELAERFNQYGIAAVHLDGFTDKNERAAVIEQFRAGEIPVLCSVAVLVKGFDAPICDCAVFAAPTKSLMKHIQSAGRALRTAPGKRKTLFLDHAGNIERLGFPDSPLPEYMDNGDKKETERKEKERKEKEVLPKPCPACFHMTANVICEMCGFERPKPSKVVEQDGKIKKLDKVDMSEKMLWLGMLLGYAREKGYKDGWASHKYKVKFGVWPAKKSGIHATKPNQDVINYIKYLNIKSAKGAK